MTARSPNHHSPPSSPSRLSRIAEIFRFSLYKSTTNFISLLAPRLKHIVSKTLDLLSMDSLFFSEDDDYYFDRYRNHHHQIQPLSEVNDDRLYFVPYRWWNEARQSLFRDLSEIEGLQYAVTLSGSRLGPVQIGGYGSQSEILLNLRREEDAEKHESTEEGASGGDCALVLEWMFLRALKWHNNAKDVENFLAAENSTWDLFPLQIRLSVLLDSTSLVVRITQKDNEVTAFNRACNIFCVKSGLFSIWDFSGQITQFFMNDKIKLSNEAGQSDAEILLELQVYGFSYCTRAIEGRNDEMEVEQSKIGDSCNSGLLKMNGSTDHVDSYFRVNSSTPFGRNYSGPCVLGLTGLYNLGNTCFMNSAIQCLVHTPELVDYFLGDYRKDVNTENPLGMNGELALAFGDLLRKLWTPGATSVAPHSFKSKLADFAPQFSGYNQHDSQEFLAFLLDGLHEDLNRVKCKPYIDLKDADDHPDEEVADEHWQNHLARNDSIIVDVCQGQYRSTLVCPACKKKSVTFDPFMYLSLPLPSTTMRMMTLMVVSTDGTALPFPVTITVPIYGRCKDLVQALSTACSLRDDETFLVAEIFNHHIIRLLDKPSDSIELIRDNDKLVAYRLPIDSEMSPLVAFNHERVERARHYNYIHGTSSLKKFGIPLVARISNLSRGSEIHKQFLKLLKPFLLPVENSLSDSDDVQNSGNKDFEMEDVVNTAVFGGDANSDSESGDYSHLGANFQFQLMEERGLYDLYPKGPKIQMNEPVQITGLPDIINVLVSWPNEMVELYDTCLLSTLPEICKTGLFTKKPQESVSLYKCLEAFLKEEPLGPEDMWYCPKCKNHQQASKKLDLWRLPEILVIHLKRFFYSRFLKNKLETFVDFPIDNFDLSSYIVCKDSRVSHHYMLYAVSNHYGSMGSGHYTAFVQHGHNRWYEFDDSHVLPVSEDQIKTSAAYVLFYRRI
ncbi:ubiquitin carboxyl-terminal hydrolase 8-like [Cornus florida]|uniref:ubiquitin carboxyl-terminal hydrolase 8-like n=1 Tax=Cornus florida TaxID=4283 RepID=UPI00289E140B|nr:ubiquitin carboxyl-terminal hydrolase 8-like [Cornus florida]